MEKFTLQLIEKEIKTGNEPWEKETRWFTETEDGFDGTAQGYGYKTPKKLYVAYWFFKNKDKINQSKGDAIRFLKENPEVKKELKSYFDEDNSFHRAKDGDDTSLKDFVFRATNSNMTEVVEKLNSIKHLWRSLQLHNYWK